MPVLAYHLTWTTYGTWLPGDERGWIRAGTLGVQPPDPRRYQQAQELMAEDAVLLTPAQRARVEDTVRAHCRIRRWALHVVNARSNHVHVVVTADRDAEDVMDQFKAWCSRHLSDDAGLVERVGRKAGRRRWFTEGGDPVRIEDEEHLRNAIRYVLEGQGEG